MKKVFILILVLLCIGCEEDTIQIPARSTDHEEVHILLTIAAYDQANLYEEKSCQTITQRDDGRVYPVVDVYESDDRIFSYKVYLGNDRYGYGRVEDFHIIELMDDALKGFMTPVIDLAAIQFYQDVEPRSFVYAPLGFDFYVNGKPVADTVNLEVKTRYSLSAVSYDHMGNEYRSEITALYSDKTMSKCDVYDTLDGTGQVIASYTVLEDYQEKIVDYVVTFSEGQFFNYYVIQVGDQVGYILEDIPQIKYHPSLVLRLSQGDQRFESANVRFNASAGFAHVIKDETDVKTLVNMVSGAMLAFEGKYQILSHEAWQEDLLIIKDERYGQDVGLEIRDIQSLDLLSQISSKYYNFKNFSPQSQGITFDMKKVLYDYWPTGKIQSIDCTGNLSMDPRGYRVEIYESEDIQEPHLEDVALYKVKGQTQDLIGTFNSSDIEKVDNERLIDIQGGQTVYWYHIKTKDGREGYSYRASFDFEEMVIPRESSYEILMTDGQAVKVNSLKYFGYNGIVFNDDFMDFKMYAYSFYDHYDDQNYCINPVTEEIEVYVRPDNPWSDELMISNLMDHAYGIPESSELVFYNKIDGTYVPYQKFVFDQVKCYDFIWIDAETISLFMEYYKYEHFYYNTPSVLRKVEGVWILESQMDNYDSQEI